MIDAELVGRARDVDVATTAERLGASLKRVSSTERAGPCPKCGGSDRFAVNIKRQIWNCRGCATGGADAISLVIHVCGCSFREAVAYLTGEDATHAPQARPRTAPAAWEPEGAAFVTCLVADIIGELGPVRRTPGEQYLAEVRNIDTDAIADVLERTDAIGWHPSVMFREQGHALDGRRLGCIVGVMIDPVTGMPTGAISRTYIHEGHKLGKARTLGKPASIVRLSADEDVLLGLHLAEGLETALDAMARGFRPMWSTGSTSLMAKFPLLSGIECLNIFADHDRNGAGQRAAREAASRWIVVGCDTHVYQRETTGDLNDAYREVER